MRQAKAILLLVFVLIPALLSAQGTDMGRIVENGGAGSYLAMVTSNSAFPEFTIYRPARLDAAAKKTNIPLIVFANGNCNNNSVPYENYLNELASFGYYIVAVGPYLFDSTTAADDSQAMSIADKDILITAIDRVCEQVRNPQSDIYGLVDTTHVCVMGQGCGGYQALIAASDPRVSTTLILNSGIGYLDDGESATVNFMINQDVLAGVHSPILFIIGGEEDPAYYPALDDYEQVANAFTVAASFPNGAKGSFHEEFGGSYSMIVIQWLDWLMKDNSVSRGIFTGEECICAYSLWELKQRNLNLVFGE